MIKVLSLFSGIGAFETALNRLNIEYELVNYCENDPYPARAYSMLHNCDMSKNLGDITQVDPTKLPTDIDLLTHGSPCFTADTLVLTKDGYKNIVDVKVGDYVLDKNNEYSKVTNFMEQGSKEIWEVKAMGSDIIRTTENHKFLVRERYYEWNNEIRAEVRKFKEPEWKECKDLTKDCFIGVAINQESKLPNWQGTWYSGLYPKMVKNLDMNDKMLWYICGRYLGDGWITRRKERDGNISGIKICCGKHEAEEFEELLENFNINYTKTEQRTTYNYHFLNKELGMFMEQFGCGAINKKIPSFVFDLPVGYIKILLQGYFDADGHINGNNQVATSISRELIYGISHLVAKAYNMPYKIYKTNKPNKCSIEGRIVNQHNQYNMSYNLVDTKQKQAFYEDGYIWMPVRKVTNTHKYEDVYDITVENSHSFTANGYIVHNCQDFSIAGKQASGDEGSNTRSSLMWYTVDIVGHVMPKIVVWENVKNVLGTKHIHNFNKYVDTLSEFGYNNYWKVLNARDYGVPQNRERIFVVSIRKDVDTETFEFPQPFELKPRLKNMLQDEDEVEEKYYLSEKMLKGLMKHNENHKQKGTGFIWKPKTGDDIANCLRANGALCPTDNTVLTPIRKYGIFDTEKSKHQAGSVWDVNGLSPTLDTMQGGYRMPCIEVEPKIIVGSTQKNAAISHDGICPTLTSAMGMGGGHVPMHNYDKRARKLTPKECFRLMGFQDNEFDKIVGISDTRLYKMAGNSIVVDVLEHIFKNLFNSIKEV